MTLVDLLTLAPGERADTFIGQPEAYGAVGIYGGHFLGQALSAGLQTVDTGKLANSFHAYFLKAGNPELPIVYHVERLREGRNYESRTITATQGEVPVFHMIASFKLPESGETHFKAMPKVPSADEIIAALPNDASAPQFPMVAGGRAEMYLVGEHFVPQEFVPGREPVIQCWMRVNDADNIDARMSQCILAFLADGPLMFNAALPYGIPFRTHRLTSLDQSVWFHQPCKVSEWMLYDQRSTAAADARGLNEGEIYDAAGNHILSAAQESMLRRAD